MTGGTISNRRINTKGKKVPQYFKPIPELIHEFGLLFPTARHAANGWVQAFAKIEGGDHSASFYKGPLTDLVSRRQVEEALRKTKVGSAPGPDGVTVDFSQMMKTWSAIQLTTLFGKSALYVQAPTQYKGGALFELYKGKASHMDMDMCRSIPLVDVIGKVSARDHRLASIGALANDFSSEHT